MPKLGTLDMANSVHVQNRIIFASPATGCVMITNRH